MKFELLNGYVLENIDDKNWAIRKYGIAKKGKREGELVILDAEYYPKLGMALRNALDKFALQSESIEELKEVVRKMDKIKDDIIDKINI